MIKTKIKNLQFQILVQSKTGGKSVSLKHDIQWKSFEDGWPNLFIENVKENCAGRDGNCNCTRVAISASHKCMPAKVELQVGGVL